MKKASRYISFLLAVITAFIMPFSAYAFTSKCIFNSKTYTHQDKFAGIPITQGIDVSNHNGDIDWAKVKAAGVDFAIIRVGCRGYGSSGKIIADTKFTEYIANAYKQGINIGVYFYSQALNKTEAVAEANYVLGKISSYKNMINMPVYYDYEFAGVSSGRLDSAWKNKKINKSIMTENAKAFCSTVENSGYKAGIYASKYFYYDNLNYKDLEDKYDIWLAHYSTKTDYVGTFRLWQFTSEGTISGIKGNVDANFMYNTITVETPKYAYTGKEVKPDIEVVYENVKLIKNVDYNIKYENNIDYGRATATVTGINRYAGIPDQIYHFDIVPTAVNNVQMVKRTASSIDVKWNEHPEAEGYKVICYNSAGDEVAAHETTATEYSFSKLNGSTWYGFAVSAIKKVGGSKYYGIESSKANIVTKPAKATGFKVTERTKSKAVISWNEMPNISKYTVFKYNYETKKYEKAGTTATNSYTLKKLKANSKFKIKVKATTLGATGKNINGARSAAFSSYTLPATPKNKSAKKAAKRKITSRWKAVSGAKGYQIQYSPSSTFANKRKKVKVGKVKKATFKAKGTAKTYYVRVRAFTKHSGKTYYSAWSKGIKVNL